MATSRYGQSAGGGQFGVINKKSNTGAKLGTVLVVLLVLGGGGFAFYFYGDVEGQVRHLQAQDELAVAAAYVQAHRGVDPRAVGALRDGLAKGRPALQKACAKALGTTKDTENTAFLGGAILESQDPSVRTAAIDAMAENGDVNISRYMNVAFEDSNHDVRMACYRLVGKLKLEAYVPNVIDGLGTSNSDMKTCAQRSLEAYLGDGRSFGSDPEQWRKWHAGEYE